MVNTKRSTKPPFFNTPEKIENLRQLARHYTAPAIANKFDCSLNTVTSYCHKHGIIYQKVNRTDRFHARKAEKENLSCDLRSDIDKQFEELLCKPWK